MDGRNGSETKKEKKKNSLLLFYSSIHFFHYIPFFFETNFKYKRKNLASRVFYIKRELPVPVRSIHLRCRGTGKKFSLQHLNINLI